MRSVLMVSIPSEQTIIMWKNLSCFTIYVKRWHNNAKICGFKDFLWSYLENIYSCFKHYSVLGKSLAVVVESVTWGIFRVIMVAPTLVNSINQKKLWMNITQTYTLIHMHNVNLLQKEKCIQTMLATSLVSWKYKREPRHWSYIVFVPVIFNKVRLHVYSINL